MRAALVLVVLLALPLAGCADPVPRALAEARALPYPQGGEKLDEQTVEAAGVSAATVFVEYPPGTNATKLVLDFMDGLLAAGWNATFDERSDSKGIYAAAIKGDKGDLKLGCEMTYPEWRGGPRTTYAVRLVGGVSVKV